MRTYLWDDRLRAVTQYGKTQNCSKNYYLTRQQLEKARKSCRITFIHLNDCQPFSVILFLDEKIELFSHLGICIQVISFTKKCIQI